jgi:hypothetical protein
LTIEVSKFKHQFQEQGITLGPPFDPLFMWPFEFCHKVIGTEAVHIANDRPQPHGPSFEITEGGTITTIAL